MEYHESKAEQLQEHDIVPIDDTQFEENEQVVSNRAESEATRQSMDQDNSSEPSGTQSEGQRLLIQDSNSSEPEDRICHLPHFIDRLLLEQYLEREFLVRLPFMVWLPILLILVTMEYPTGIMFEIHSNLRNHLGLDDVAEATTSDTIYSFLTDTFIPGMSGMNPADDEFVNSTMTDDGFIELSQKKPYRQATALVTYPILYIVRGPDSTGKCSDLGEFGQAYQNFFRTFYYCHLLPMSPVGNTSSQSTSNSTENSTATGFQCGDDPSSLPDLLQCFDKSSDTDSLPAYQSSWPVQNHIARVMVKSGVTRQAAVDVAPTVDRIAFYKDNSWIDGSASAVGTLTTFYTPVADIYTFVSVFYEISAVGHIEGSVYLNSFKDVSPLAFWLVGMLLAIGLTLVQTGIDMFRAFHPGHLARGVGMKEYLLGMHAVHLGIPGQSNESTNKDGDGPIAAEAFASSANDEYHAALRKRKKNLRASAIFESLCDLFVLSTLILKLAAYLPSVGLTVPSFLGTLEFSKVALSLLSWDPHTETAQYLADLHRASQIETLADSLRTLTMVTLCVCCSRFVFFLATHPRVAILAETVRIGSDDMFHFFILFATLYSLLAFLARWVFGDSLAQFKSFNAALYTQFQMLIGEWPFDDFDGYENQGVMIFYMILFGIVMFFMVLNFFLAIVVDSFESTKQEIEEYKVEGSLFSDVWHLMVQFVMRQMRQWPSRAIFVEKLSKYREDAARQTGAALPDESGIVVQTSETKKVSLEKFKTYFDSPAEREGVESMFYYYHDHFAQEPEDFLHPLFGRSQSVKIQMASAVQDIGSLVSSIAVETDQFMTEIRDRVAMMSQKSADMVREVTKEKLEKARLKADLAVANEKLLYLEQENGQLRKRLDIITSESATADDINEIVDPIERKLALLDFVIKAVNKQRALFASRVAGNLPLPKHTLESISTGMTFGVPHPDQALPPALPPSVAAKRHQKALLRATKRSPRHIRPQGKASLSRKRLLPARARSASPTKSSRAASDPPISSPEAREEPIRTGQEDPPEPLSRSPTLTRAPTEEALGPSEDPSHDEGGNSAEEGPFRYHMQRRDGHYDFDPKRRPSGPAERTTSSGESKKDDAPNEIARVTGEAALRQDSILDPGALGSEVSLNAEGYHLLMQQIYRFHCTEFQLLIFMDRLAQSMDLEIVDHDAAHDAVSDLLTNMREPLEREASRGFARLRDLVIDAAWTQRREKAFL